MLPARNRMTRSTDFDATVKRGVRASQPDIVIHVRCRDAAAAPTGPRVGFVVAKSVGSAVQRHRVTRRLRHVARGVLEDMNELEYLVIRALPSSRDAASSTLDAQLRAGLRRAHKLLSSPTGPTL